MEGPGPIQKLSSAKREGPGEGGSEPPGSKAPRGPSHPGALLPPPVPKQEGGRASAEPAWSHSQIRGFFYQRESERKWSPALKTKARAATSLPRLQPDALDQVLLPARSVYWAPSPEVSRAVS